MEWILGIGIVVVVCVILNLITSVLNLIGTANLNKKADATLTEQKRMGQYYE